MRPENRSDALSFKLEAISEERFWNIVVKIRHMIQRAICKYRLIHGRNLLTYDATLEQLKIFKLNRLECLRQSLSDAAKLKEEAVDLARKVLHLRQKLHLRYGKKNY